MASRFPAVRRRYRVAAVSLVTALTLTGALTDATGAAGLTRTVAAPSAAIADSPVRVNQLGYLPDGPKRATVVSSSAQPLAWQLLDASGRAVASGSTTPRGSDEASGDSTHLADFTSYRGTGKGFRLVVDGQSSPVFDIRPGLYSSLFSDSMSFFYQQRSGTPIEASLAGPEYARPAGQRQPRRHLRWR
ncbi:cellulase N-terminal Ig-like domain-containing protein, partial [Streptomyces achromogenes]|uniref:cellulase N-terminal Ig-like domain-containing protein n=1 Tax=Streptomyces achromogenes TaxID=67255 RepID=UPI0033E36186